MNQLSKILDDLDEFFNSKKDNEKYLYFFLPVLLFGFLTYQFIFPVTDKMLKQEVATKGTLKTEIDGVNNALNKLKIANSTLPHKIKNNTNTYKELLNKQEKVDFLVKQLDFLKFDIRKWGSFYNQLPKFARENNLTIDKLDNEVFLDNKNNKLISKKMDITITLNGKYMNMLKFLENFENRKELIRINEVKSDFNKTTIKVNVFGANL